MKPGDEIVYFADSNKHADLYDGETLEIVAVFSHLGFFLAVGLDPQRYQFQIEDEGHSWGPIDSKEKEVSA